MTKRRWPWIAAVAAIATAVVMAVVVAWLMLRPNSMGDDRARIAAIQVVSTIGVSIGGLGTLMLFVRRQWLQEQAHALDRERVELDRTNSDRQHERELAKAAHEQHDATERRITELYMKAAEQLGHTNASVRLAAMYALDRLGQTAPSHRQVIADIWCGYLRQPATPPPSFRDQVIELDPVHAGTQPNTRDTDPAEHEVRATALRLLINHVKDPRDTDRAEAPSVTDEGFWGLSRLDLTGATLANTDFGHCWLPTVVLDRAQLYGHSSFNFACLPTGAQFHDATFHGEATFAYTAFHQRPNFTSAIFTRDATFFDSTFDKGAIFEGAVFHRLADYCKASFSGLVQFTDATILGTANFYKVHLKAVSFFGTKFNGGTEFDKSMFTSGCTFRNARFAVPPNLSAVLAKLHGQYDTLFDWPPGWVLEPDPDSAQYGRPVHNPTATQADPSPDADALEECFVGWRWATC